MIAIGLETDMRAIRGADGTVRPRIIDQKVGACLQARTIASQLAQPRTQPVRFRRSHL